MVFCRVAVVVVVVVIVVVAVVGRCKWLSLAVVDVVVIDGGVTWSVVLH